MSDLYATDERIIEMLRPPQHIGVLGVSRKPHRASYRVTEYLIGRGYQVSLINPALSGSMLFDRPVYASLAECSAAEGRLDWVDIFRAAEHLPDIFEQAVACEAGGLWGQLEIVDPVVARAALDRGMQVVMDRCPAIEIPRLEHQLN